MAKPRKPRWKLCIPTGFPELPKKDAQIHQVGPVLMYLIMRNNRCNDKKLQIVQSSANARQQATRIIKALKKNGINTIGEFVTLSQSDYHTYPTLGRKRLALLDECYALLHRPDPMNPAVSNSEILLLHYYAEEPLDHLHRLLSLCTENPGSSGSKRLAAQVVAILKSNYVTTVQKFATMPRYNFDKFYGLGNKSMSIIEQCRNHLADNKLVG